MAVQIKRGKRSFLVGMEWELAQDKTDAKALLKRAGAKARIMLSPQGDDRAWIGYAERGQKGLAAAALVAEVLGDVIVAAPAQAGRTWLCATSQGMPIPSRDVVIASEDVRDTLLEWMSYYPSASLYGDVNGAIGSVDDMWARLDAAQDNGDVSKRRLKQLQVITPASAKDKLVLLGIVALLGGGFAGWHFFLREKPLTPQELAKRRAAGQALQSAAAERMRKEAPVRAHFDAIDKRFEYWRTELNRDALEWISAIDQLPVFSYGYAAASGACQADKCVVEWQPKAPSPSAAARMKLAGFVVPQDPKTVQDSVIKTESSVTPRTRAQAPSSPSQAEKNLAAARWILIDELQTRLSGMTVTVDPFQSDLVPGVPAAGVPAFEVANTATVRANFAGAGASTAIKEYVRHLQKHPVVVDKISFAINGNSISFGLDGRFVALHPPFQRPAVIEFEGERAIFK